LLQKKKEETQGTIRPLREAGAYQVVQALPCAILALSPGLEIGFLVKESPEKCDFGRFFAGKIIGSFEQGA
jgi:hypothetical protein